LSLALTLTLIGRKGLRLMTTASLRAIHGALTGSFALPSRVYQWRDSETMRQSGEWQGRLEKANQGPFSIQNALAGHLVSRQGAFVGTGDL